MRACLAASAFIEGPSVLVSSAAQSREPRWSPSGVVASGTRGNTLGGPSVWPTSPHVSRRRASSRGWAWPTSVGIDVPQCAQRVRRARLPSARKALPLVAIDVPLSLFLLHQEFTSLTRRRNRGSLPAMVSVADDVPTAWRIPPAATVAPRTSSADVDAPSLQVGAIQPLNRSHRVRLPRHLNVANALRSAIRPVHHDVRGTHRAVGREGLTEIALRHFERQIADE